MDFKFLFTACVLCLLLGVDLEMFGLETKGGMTEVQLVRDDLTTE